MRSNVSSEGLSSKRIACKYGSDLPGQRNYTSYLEFLVYITNIGVFPGEIFINYHSIRLYSEGKYSEGKYFSEHAQ